MLEGFRPEDTAFYGYWGLTIISLFDTVGSRIKIHENSSLSANIKISSRGRRNLRCFLNKKAPDIFKNCACTTYNKINYILKYFCKLFNS